MALSTPVGVTVCSITARPAPGGGCPSTVRPVGRGCVSPTRTTWPRAVSASAATERSSSCSHVSPGPGESAAVRGASTSTRPPGGMPGARLAPCVTWPSLVNSSGRNTVWSPVLATVPCTRPPRTATCAFSPTRACDTPDAATTRTLPYTTPLSSTTGCWPGYTCSEPEGRPPSTLEQRSHVEPVVRKVASVSGATSVLGPGRIWCWPRCRNSTRWDSSTLTDCPGPIRTTWISWPWRLPCRALPTR